jgi:transposase
LAPEAHNINEGQRENGLLPQKEDASHPQDGWERPSPPILDKLLRVRNYARPPPNFKSHITIMETLVKTLTNVKKIRIQLQNQLSALIYLHGIPFEDLRDVYLVDALLTIHALEREISSRIKGLMNNGPYSEDPVVRFLMGIPGIKHELAAQFMAEVISLERFSSLRSLYHYAGYHVVDGHAPTLRDMAQGRTRWNQNLRAIVYKMVMSILKAHARTPNKYGELYYAARRRYEERGDYKNRLHLHLRAARIVAKQLLRDVWKTSSGVTVDGE